MRHHIEGTTLFDGDQAQKGYALNRMCFSFNSAENRAAFRANEDAYCAQYGLTPQQRAVARRFAQTEHRQDRGGRIGLA
jgi:protocatechuate 4,5-dioxygenase, alpha chain